MTLSRRKKGVPAKNADVPSTLLEPVLTEYELVIARLIDAPRSRVFQAWTDPTELVCWWGPNGFTTPVCELDVRPGGGFSMAVRDPEGEVYPIRGIYREVVPHERLAYSDDWAPELGLSQASHVTVNFNDQAGKTLLAVHAHFESPEARDTMEQQGLIEGWSEGLERLARHLGVVSSRD